MASTDLVFTERDAHRAWLAGQAALPAGFRVAAVEFPFTPVEVGKQAEMRLGMIALDEPTPDFAAVFTRNAFPGAPVIIGRRRLDEPRLGALVVNNKISNVCAPDGVATGEAICARAGELLGMPGGAVLPGSTGVIGWQLPREAMLAHLPQAVAALRGGSILPVAEAIMTTDLYPKVRRIELGGGSIVGIAKGAGMIEPDLATMLVYICTDLAVPRAALRAALRSAVAVSFNCMTIDSDTSTSDTVALLSSGRVPCDDPDAFVAALTTLCADLAEDVARNGEGVHHVVRVAISGAPDEPLARGVGKAVVNSPLLQCAICGNDPNVGRLVMAVGKHLGACEAGLDLSCCRMSLGSETVFADGAFALDPAKEERLHRHLAEAELYASVAPDDGLSFRPPLDFPPHERCVEIAIDLGCGSAGATVIGTDRSHEYITENADYRS